MRRYALPLLGSLFLHGALLLFPFPSLDTPAPPQALTVRMVRLPRDAAVSPAHSAETSEPSPEESVPYEPHTAEALPPEHERAALPATPPPLPEPEPAPPRPERTETLTPPAPTIPPKAPSPKPSPAPTKPAPTKTPKTPAPSPAPPVTPKPPKSPEPTGMVSSVHPPDTTAPAKPGRAAPPEQVAPAPAGTSTPKPEPGAGEPPLPAAPEGVLDVQTLEVLRRVDPAYPPSSRKRGEEGTAVLLLSVAKGKVQEVAVEKSSGFPRLDEAAAAALRRWLFSPSLTGQVRVPVVFRLE